MAPLSLQTLSCSTVAAGVDVAPYAWVTAQPLLEPGAAALRGG